MPDQAVLTRNDYVEFEQKRGMFSTQLRGHLVSHSFLFLGYSFSDPNIDYILFRIRSLLGANGRPHFCVMRDIVATPDRSKADIEYERRKLALRIDDLQTYGIQTLLVTEFSEVTDLLRELNRRAVRRSVFVSGSAVAYAALSRARAEEFCHKLGASLIEWGCTLVSGIGLGIGGAVTVGALDVLYRTERRGIGDRVVLRPFPQVAPAGRQLPDLWEQYRQEMLRSTGVAIFLFGNKVGPVEGEVVEANGCVREFEIAVQHGAFPVAVGGTGYAAARIAATVLADPHRYFGQHAMTPT